MSRQPPSRRPPGRETGSEAGREAGFTLVEMLVVMAIVSVVLAAGAATLARRDMTPSPRQAAERIGAVLLRARDDALRTGRETGVLLDLGAHRLAYPPDAAPEPLPEGIAVSLRAGAGAAEAPGRITIRFHSDGSSSGADLDLARRDGDGRADGARLVLPWLTGLPRIGAAP